MLHVYEFEIFEDEGLFMAFPYDMDGGTQGRTFKEACEMAADWLQAECEHRAMHGLPFPDATFGNEPRNGGKTVIVAVSAGKDTVRRMSKAEAARALLDNFYFNSKRYVTAGRVTQMVAANKLESFELNGREWVTTASVEARIREKPRAGRPKATA